MTLRITIKMDNAAFEGQAGEECARILREAAEQLEGRDSISRGTIMSLRDYNGNNVGEVKAG